MLDSDLLERRIGTEPPGFSAAELVRKSTLIARKQGVWQGYLTCEKAEKGREISDRIGANGSAKKGQKRRKLTPYGTGKDSTKSQSFCRGKNA